MNSFENDQTQERSECTHSPPIVTPISWKYGLMLNFLNTLSRKKAQNGAWAYNWAYGRDGRVGKVFEISWQAPILKYYCKTAFQLLFFHKKVTITISFQKPSLSPHPSHKYLPIICWIWLKWRFKVNNGAQKRVFGRVMEWLWVLCHWVIWEGFKILSAFILTHRSYHYYHNKDGWNHHIIIMMYWIHMLFNMLFGWWGGLQAWSSASWGRQWQAQC